MAGQLTDFLTAIGLPRGVAGYLDWTTGLMRVNASRDAWERIARVPDLSALEHWEQRVVETVTHETIHFLQISTTSYLYAFAVRLFELVKSAIRFPVRDVSELPTEATPELAAKLREHFATLDAPGPEHVTVRSLAEGQAMLAQLRTHWRGLTADGFLSRLTMVGLPAEYSHAYLVAHRTLGAAAFEIYPFVSSLALCTEAPASSFVSICQELRQRGVTVLPSKSVREYLALANELHEAGRIVMAGTSAEVVNNLPRHPLYSPMVSQINELAAQTSILDYMAAPHRIAEPLAVAVARPAVYNRDIEGTTAVHVPDNWRPDLDRKSRDAEAKMLVLLMSVSARLLRLM